MNRRKRSGWIVFSVLICATAHTYGSDSPTTSPATQPSSGEFLRYVDDGKGGAKLQTSIVSYANDAGVTVHLVAALHVGEKSYYDGLAKTFDGYDALLYEMVKPKGSGVPIRGQASGSMIGAFQRWLKDVLELDYQLDDIDYGRPNFVHADLDWETFEQLQSDRGESIMGIMLQSMLHQWAKQMESADNSRDISFIDLLVALQSGSGPPVQASSRPEFRRYRRSDGRHDRARRIGHHYRAEQKGVAGTEADD